MDEIEVQEDIPIESISIPPPSFPEHAAATYASAFPTEQASAIREPLSLFDRHGEFYRPNKEEVSRIYSEELSPAKKEKVDLIIMAVKSLIPEWLDVSLLNMIPNNNASTDSSMDVLCFALEIDRRKKNNIGLKIL